MRKYSSRRSTVCMSALLVDQDMDEVAYIEKILVEIISSRQTLVLRFGQLKNHLKSCKLFIPNEKPSLDLAHIFTYEPLETLTLDVSKERLSAPTQYHFGPASSSMLPCYEAGSCDVSLLRLSLMMHCRAHQLQPLLISLGFPWYPETHCLW